MDILKLTPGDFLKNAGIVGFLRMWEFHMRRQGKPFGVTDEISVEELLEIDLPQAYIDAFVEYFGKGTRTSEAFVRIDRLIELLGGKPETVERDKLKSDLEFITNSLIMSSLKSGFEGIRNEIENTDIYLNLIKKKIKAPGPKEDLATVCAKLLPRLKELRIFCSQPKVRQTFLFKTVIYNVIEKFWKGVSFLNRSNSKKPIPDTISETFTEPLKAFLSKKEHNKNNPRCISCGMPMANKDERRSIAFLADMADDLTRKTSAFWNCTPDAFLCPICAFLYALSPLGFCQVDNGDFVFINANDSVQTLWTNNQVKMDDEGKPLSYHARIDNAILQLLESKSKIQNNIQVVTRVKRLEDQYRYHFNIIDRELTRLTQEKTVKKALKRLAKRPSNDDSLNVYRLCIENLLNYRNQFNLLYMLVSESLKQWGMNDFLRSVFEIQCVQLSQKEEEYPMELSKLQHFASKSGSELRRILIAEKIGRENATSVPDEKKEDIIRGVVYQLTNALKVQNVEQFVDIIIRLYSSYKLPIPRVFMQALQSGDQFTIIGYAFILGLKGAYDTKENKEGEKTND